MAPEQARSLPVGKRADIWAFGCVLYEMLAGRKAFGDEDVSMTLSKVLQREPDFSALSSAVPARVRQALAVCLRKDPKQRAGDIHDVWLALEGAFETAIKQAGAPVALPRWRRVAPVSAAALLAGASPTAANPSEIQFTTLRSEIPRHSRTGDIRVPVSEHADRIVRPEPRVGDVPVENGIEYVKCLTEHDRWRAVAGRVPGHLRNNPLDRSEHECAVLGAVIDEHFGIEFMNRRVIHFCPVEIVVSHRAGGRVGNAAHYDTVTEA